MTPLPAPRDDQPTEHADGRDAQMLALLVRGSRLTLLYGPPGSGKTALIHGGLMPQLRRRSSDLTDRPGPPGPPDPPGRVPGSADAAPGNIVQMPDRRQPAAGQSREVALVFDQWDANASSRLKTRLQDLLPLPEDARPERELPLKALFWRLHYQSGARFLLAFDAFDRCLRPDRDEDHDCETFIGEMLDVIDDRRLPVHFLLAVRSEDEPCLARFRERIPGFDNHYLRLPVRAARPPQREQQTPAPVAAPTDALQASAGGNHTDAFDEAAATAAVAAEGEVEGGVEVGVGADVEAGLGAGLGKSPPPWTVQERRPRVSALAWLAGAGAVVAGLLWGWTVWPPGSQGEPLPGSPQAFEGATAPRPSSPPVAGVASPGSAAPPLQVVGIVSDDLGGSSGRLIEDLRRWVAPGSGLDIEGRPAAGWQEALAGLTEPGRMVVARYDALRAARASLPADAGLQIVAPLYREQLQLVVRADSPLRYIHEIRGRSLNVGPATSSRALTAGVLYGLMFGLPPEPGRTDARGEAAALQALLGGAAIDVVVLVAAGPSPWLAGLPAAAARSLRVLSLDPQHPASRRALQSFLPGTLPPEDDGAAGAAQPTPTLSLLSFLVTSAASNRADDGWLQAFATSLCSRLDVLRQDGSRRWREVQPAARFDVGWPYAADAQQAFRECSPGGPQPAQSPVDRPPAVDQPTEQRSPR